MEVLLDGTYVPRGADVLVQEVSEEKVLVDLASGIYHGLNRVGTEIWNDLDGTRTLRQIAAGLAARYPEVEPARLEADVTALVQSLADNDLVRPG